MLLDTNVLVAAAVASHLHHAQSSELIARTRVTIAAHSLAEFANTVTRASRYAWSGEVAARQIDFFFGTMDVRALTAGQMSNACTAFVRRGFRGPMIYDYLIGEHAVLNGVATIASWNARHMKLLFPQLRVLSPAELLEAL